MVITLAQNDRSSMWVGRSMTTFQSKLKLFLVPVLYMTPFCLAKTVNMTLDIRPAHATWLLLAWRGFLVGFCKNKAILQVELGIGSICQHPFLSCGQIDSKLVIHCRKDCLFIVQNTSNQSNGRSRIFGRGSKSGGLHNSKHCYIIPSKGGSSILALVMQNIVEALYVYAEVAKQLIIRKIFGT